MNNHRRSFLKKATIASAVVVTGAVAMAGQKSQNANDNGVVIGKAKKKEVLYKTTQVWDEYYKRAL